MQIKGGDSLRISYQLEDGIFDEDYDNTRTLPEKEWLIDYIRKNADWAATDSTLFEEKDMCLCNFTVSVFYRNFNAEE